MRRLAVHSGNMSITITRPRPFTRRHDTPVLVPATLPDGTYRISALGALHPDTHTTGYYIGVRPLCVPVTDRLDVTVPVAWYVDYLGVWIDRATGLRYIDQTIYVDDRAAALEMGARYRQICVWDIAAGTELFVPSVS